MRAQPGYARRKVLERDRGVCSSCGLDCARLERLVDGLARLAYAELHYSTVTGAIVREWWLQTDPVELRPHPAAERRRQDLDVALAILGLWAGHDLRKLGDFAVIRRCQDGGTDYVRRLTLKRSLWQADHIVPVVEGGGGCGLDNLRTLCTRCHKTATAGLAKRRSRRAV